VFGLLSAKRSLIGVLLGSAKPLARSNYDDGMPKSLEKV
jgi:hypothetical protein